MEVVEIELDRLEDRVVRLTPMSSRLSGAVLSNDGDKLFFLSAFEKGYDLWELDVREKSTKILKKLDGGGAALVLNKKGDNIYVLSGGNLQKIEAKSGKSSLTVPRNANICITTSSCKRRNAFSAEIIMARISPVSRRTSTRFLNISTITMILRS